MLLLLIGISLVLYLVNLIALLFDEEKLNRHRILILIVIATTLKIKIS